jgi:hypothetical protein
MYSKVHVSPCRLDGFPVDCNQDKDHSHKDPRILGLVENLVLCGDSASRPFFTFSFPTLHTERPPKWKEL